MSVYEIITDQIIKKLEEGVVPWRKTWVNGLPSNFVSKRAYTGMNSLLLGLSDFESPYWLTFKQCNALGGRVKKDCKATQIIFWNIVENKKKKDKDDKDKIFILRYHNVYNTDQCEGLSIPDSDLTQPIDKIKVCENVVKNYKTCPPINATANAFYAPKRDSIGMPTINNFTNSESYYSVLFHEMGHSTGHESRLDRKEVVGCQPFGSESYSKEELVAELTSAFLCGTVGIAPAIIDNAASYIQNWKSALKEDSKLIISAASKAQKAADFILNIKRDQ